MSLTVPYFRDELNNLRRENRELRELLKALVISAPQHVLYVSDLAKALAGTGRLTRTRHGMSTEESLSWEKD